MSLKMRLLCGKFICLLSITLVFWHLSGMLKWQALPKLPRPVSFTPRSMSLPPVVASAQQRIAPLRVAFARANATEMSKAEKMVDSAHAGAMVAQAGTASCAAQLSAAEKVLKVVSAAFKAYKVAKNHESLQKAGVAGAALYAVLEQLENLPNKDYAQLQTQMLQAMAAALNDFDFTPDLMALP